jgi:phthalate 4,5-dioxygenase oxygenase subunit
MISAEQNDFITRVGPGAPAGKLLRRYWQPVALADELAGPRPVKPVKLMGQDLVLFRDESGRSACSTATARTAAPTSPSAGTKAIRAAPSTAGSSTPRATAWRRRPSPPAASCAIASSSAAIRCREERHPVRLVRRGRGPALPCLRLLRRAGHAHLRLQGPVECNWLQALRGRHRPGAPSFLHRFLNDASLDAVGDNAAGRSSAAPAVASRRRALADDADHARVPPARDLLRAQADWGLQLTALRPMTDELTHVRVTNAIFPHTFVIPLSETLTITQMHVPVDDTHTYWYSVFTSFGGPVDKRAMRNQRLQFISLPDYVPKSGRHNNWGFNADEQRTDHLPRHGRGGHQRPRPVGRGEHGPIQDRTREHLGTSDKVIMANRRMLLKAIEAVLAGGWPRTPRTRPCSRCSAPTAASPSRACRAAPTSPSWPTPPPSRCCRGRRAPAGCCATPTWPTASPAPSPRARSCSARCASSTTWGWTSSPGSRWSSTSSSCDDARMGLADSGQPGEPPRVSLLSHGHQYLTELRYDRVDTLMELLRSQLIALGLPLRSLEIEFGPSQFELTSAPPPA